METRKRNLAALGLLVAVAGVLFVWGLFFLLGDPFWERGTNMVVLMEDGAKLRRGDRIHLHGVEVGTVREVTLRPPRQVAVEVRLKRGIVLPADTRAGDYIEIGMLGAYGCAMRTAFNGFGSDETVIVEDEPMASLYLGDEREVASNVVTL